MSKKVVYKIKNTINGKVYIGSTQDKERRWGEHKLRLRNNYHRNPHLQNAWNKYGAASFEFSVIEKLDKDSDLINREQYHMDKLNPEYNIRPKADRSAISEETRRKISEVLKGRDFSVEHRKKLSKALKGIERSEEHKKKLGKSLKGRTHSEETKRKIGESNKGKKVSQEIKRKISESEKGCKGLKGEENPQSKLTEEKVKVILYLLDGDSFTHKEIGKMYNVSGNTISAISTGRNWGYVSI